MTCLLRIAYTEKNIAADLMEWRLRYRGMTNKSFSGQRRLAIGASVIWLLLVLFYFQESEEVRLSLLFGVLPVVAGWVIFWVYRGFQDEHKAQGRRRWFRFRNKDRLT